ncbi:hypothetical protein ACLEJW_16230 [Pseudomonas sp. SMSB3]|uniref:hypothetical protein n=1 Tax=unclassified Pseudomonas TaxID=196821 RepID=UPI0028AB75DC|nr:hypothetical protein [Pseudomonas sp.]
MKTIFQFLCSTVCLLATGQALAGPPVEVTFKNLSAKTVTLQLTNANENSTYLIANPKPEQKVNAGQSIKFTVQRQVSPDVNGASLRYSDGTKTCAFGTSFVMMMSGGMMLPKWSKAANPSGGATCTAVNSGFGANYSWKAEFVMK